MKICSDREGLRLDAYLPEIQEGLSRNAVQKLLEKGEILVNGKPVKKNYKVKNGDEIEFSLPEPEIMDILPENIPLDILYEDEDVIVINKPKGLVVHPAPGHWSGTLVNALMYHCGDSLSGINGEKRPGIVHRIDMDTSGLLIVAKNDFAHTALADQLQDHSLSRVYEAVVVGNIKADSGTINAPIGRHPLDRKKMTVTAQGGRDAVTHFEVIERYQGFTHLRLHLETGRTHQIRVHLSWQNHPILGDSVYGKGKQLGLDTQCLHARCLTFRHPRDGREVTVESPLPEYFVETLRKIQAMTR